MSRPNSSDIVAIETSMVVDFPIEIILNFKVLIKCFEFFKFSFSENLFVSKNQVVWSQCQSFQTAPIKECLMQF